MTAPQSLLQMTGADLTPAKLSEAVLVMIDFQNEYLTGALPLNGVEDAVTEGARLLARARREDTPIIHIAHAGRPGGAFDRSQDRGQIIGVVAPLEGEPVIEKPRPNAFSSTTLQESLETLGKQEVILAGFMTHMCVSSTARAALDLGYRTTVVTAATATRDLPGPDGTPVEAAALQRASLAALADRFAILAPTTDELPE